MEELCDALSPEGIARVKSFVAPGMLLAFDFDGTLAPIVPLPEAARMEPSVEEALHALRTGARLAIITGRSLADIDARVDLEMDYVIGNHGLEWREVCPPAFSSREVPSELRHDLVAWAGSMPGVVVEDKGHSLSIHCRAWSEDEEAFLERVRSWFDGRGCDVRLVGGKEVVNVLPREAPGKGRALLHLLECEGFSKALFVGDDITDNDVFALDDARLLSVGVGMSPRLLVSLRIARQSEIVRFLSLLKQLLCGKKQ